MTAGYKAMYLWRLLRFSLIAVTLAAGLRFAAALAGAPAARCSGWPLLPRLRRHKARLSRASRRRAPPRAPAYSHRI